MAVEVERGDGDGRPGVVVPFAPYTRLYHHYSDGLLGRVSSDAIAIVVYITRHTLGYGRDSVEATDTAVAGALRLSLRAFQRAKAELKAARVFEMTPGAGRGKPTVYKLTTPDTWALPANMADNHQIRMAPGAVALPANMADNDYPPKQPVILAVNSVQRNEGEGGTTPGTEPPHVASQAEASTIPERKKEREGRASRAKAPRAAKSKMAPDELAAHNAKAAYITKLVAALAAELKGAKFPHGEKAERGHAEWYYTAGRDGGPAPIEDVMACWRLAKTGYWAGIYLGLASLKTSWTTWVAEGPHAVKASVQREMAKTAARSGPRAPGSSPRVGPYAAPPPAVVRASASIWDD